MIKWTLVALFLVSSAQAYVPTVESLFRHGSNPDVTVNGLNVTFSVKRLQASDKESSSDSSLMKEDRKEDFYKVFLTLSTGDILKVAQTRYDNNTFSESSLLHKTYYPNFTPFTLKASNDQIEKGIFYSLLQSLLLNNGEHMVNYLKSLNVPVKLNSELINREKVELLAEYKRYLVTINKDRNAKKTEENPLRPSDTSARERAEKIMNDSMYVNTNQVKLSKEDGQMSWLISAEPFEAVVSYRMREIQKIKFKSDAGEFEILCKDYWLANGTHSLPRYMLVKTFAGETYEIQITNLRHYNEKEADLVKRLEKWDQLLKGKTATDPRPAFLL